MIEKRANEIKKQNLELVITAIIKILKSDSQHVSYSKWVKRVLGEQYYEIYNKKDDELVKQKTFDLLIALTKKVNDKNYQFIIKEMIVHEISEEKIQKIKQVRKKEMLIYLGLNMFMVLTAYFVYFINYYKMEFIPIMTQIIVIILSLRLKLNYAMKSGIVLALLNLTLVYPLKEIIVQFNYSFILLLVLEYILLGFVIAVIPKLISSFLTRYKVKISYSLYIASFTSSLIFTLFLTFVYRYYMKVNQMVYQPNYILKIFQPIFISIICVQLIEIFTKKEKK